MANDRRTIPGATYLLALTVVACACRPAPDTAPGVSRALAQHRAETIANIRYTLSFTIPETPTEPVMGSARVRFELRDVMTPVVLDFAAPSDHLRGVRIDGEPITVEQRNGHLVIPTGALRIGENAIDIDFVAGDDALNRQPEFLYTLFVPDRASSAFPSFDQPDAKASFALSLVVPAHWTAVANGPALRDTVIDTRREITFKETRPISTYVFAFTAGVFSVETAERHGRTMRLYHRETDTARVRPNLDAIFDLHATALSWLEAYTGLPYAFDKFDFVAVPAFQFGGMEHVGAILYRASSLFLDESATKGQQLGRASLIAHETAHMWFGNLVTMQWFNDVWMKEVFANFMAAKIVNPSFPDINHDLRFFLAHHRSAYAVDRTEGANPIRQPLDNLREAGSLYGAIIYQKAPIVMRHLERMIGEDAFRDGLREYMLAYQFGNATWSNLIDILDERSEHDLRQWSRVWVEEPGRPTVRVRTTSDGGRVQLHVEQSDPLGRRRRWNQRIALLTTTPTGSTELDTDLTTAGVTINLDANTEPEAVVPGTDGVGYARFELDQRSIAWLLRRWQDLPDPVHRAVAWSGLWEALLANRVAADTLLDFVIRVVGNEPDELLAQRLLSDAVPIYWRYLDPDRRRASGPALERALWSGVEQAEDASRKSAFFDAFVATATTEAAFDRLERVWRDEGGVTGLPVSERQLTEIALELAVRDAADAKEILATQLARIENADRRARFVFVMPAVSPDSAVRDSVFASFANPKNRERESWVLDAMGYLNHPHRAARAEHFVYPALELVSEIQATGDIFFPLRWLHATLDGHRSRSAAATVRRFLDERPRYPDRLRAKILQAADGLFRVTKLTRLEG